MIEKGCGEIVFMAPKSGGLVLGTPLYKRSKFQTEGFKIDISVEHDKPIVYAIDCGHDPDHKVPNGGDCYACDGTGYIEENQENKTQQNNKGKSDE